MATLQNRIELSDGVSPAFRKMTQAAGAAADRFEQAGAAVKRFDHMADFNGAAMQMKNFGAAATVSVGNIDEVIFAASRLPPILENAGASMSGLNARLNETSGILGRVKAAVKTTFGQFTLASLAAGTAASLAASLASIPQRLAAASDGYGGIMARLALVMGRGQAAIELNDAIYKSALRARGGYAEMAAAVAGIAMTAKEAFPDARQVVPFMEGVQKLFAIGGTDRARQQDALLQLTQALGSGRLQGDEFRSIAEAAPLIEKMVADYMGVSQGALKKLSSEGAITAEIMRNAILGNLSVINEQFESMPMKWSDVWQNIATRAYKAFTPVFDAVSRLANSDLVRSVSETATTGITVLAAAITGVAQNIEWLYGVAAKVGGYIGEWLAAGFAVLEQAAETVLPYVIGYIISYSAAWLLANSVTAVHAAIAAAVAAKQFICTAATAAWTAATGVLTAAQIFLQLIMGNWMVLIAAIPALIVLVIGALLGWRIATNGLRNTVAEAFEVMGNIVESSVNFMISCINGLIKLINKAAEGINGVFGTNISAVGEITYHAEGYGQSWRKFAEEFSLQGLMENVLPKMPNAADMDFSAASVPSVGDSLDDIAGSGKDTADNTKGIKDAMDILGEDIKYLRDFAEQEAINKYTTAEVKIEMGGVQQNISSEVDADGIIDLFVEKLQEGMAAGAEAVHE